MKYRNSEWISMLEMAGKRRGQTPRRRKYFESVSKMAVDLNASPEYQELGEVLRNYMAGVKNPDLSRLTEEIRQIVEDELGNK